MPDLSQTNKLSHEQKISFILLLIFSVFAIGLGIVKIRNTMYSPFALSNAIPSSIKELANNINTLQYRDTDFDGLSDFEELYVYQTSPYLDDSDSDGVKDKDEIVRGTNPLCNSVSSDCSGGVFSASGIDESSSTLFIGNLQPPTKPDQDLNAILSDPIELRKALSSSGVDSSILEQLTDQQLLDIVQDAIPSSTYSNLVPIQY